jgi:catechol-2,3-dioxygenase
MSVGTHAPPPPSGSTGLFHFAFELEDKKQFAAFFKKFRDAGLRPETVDYGISMAMYVPDPSHNIVELYVDTREKAKEWKGRTKLLREEEISTFLE